MHKHRIKTHQTFGFSYPVRQPPNPAAHGGVMHVDTCSCGAVRRTNTNGMHIERGPWLTEDRASSRGDFVVTHGYTDGTKISACSRHTGQVPNFSPRGASYSGVYRGAHVGHCDLCEESS